MREDTKQPYETCVYCKQPITEKLPPIKRLASGEAAHLSCYLDHIEGDETKD